ncbi:hypothetical protein ACI78R_04435 [Geodermatophilus sp. SYSU D01106]
MSAGTPGRDGPGRGGRPVPRPAPLLVATLLGFLLGLWALLYAALLFSAARADGVLAAIAAVWLGITVLCVAGGVQALTGRGGRLLAAGGVAVAALSLLGVVTSVLDGTLAVWPLVLAAAGAGVVVLLNRPASREFLSRPRA